MSRRTFLKSILGAAALSASGGFRLSSAQSPGRLRLANRVRPGDPDWPSAAEWERLNKAVGGRLSQVASPLEACREHSGALCDAALKNLQNPYFIQDQAGATQTIGWLDGWTSSQSVYAVRARTVQDVVATVNFAREKNLRLVIKGGAHSYLGQSNAPDSLLLWTKDMDAMTLHDAFVPAGCAAAEEAQPAVSVGAGAIWGRVYDLVTTRNKRYVQGGGCATVGVAGHIQTGGFGSFSKNWGLAGAGLLEAEIVTADGEVRIANRCTNPDLFYALKGGGASYGVVTRLTLRTHDLPETFGFVGQTIKARNDEAFQRLTAAFLRFAAEALITPHWGEQVTFSSDNSLSIAMTFQGLDKSQAQAIWTPFQAWLAEHSGDFAEVSEPRIVTMPARRWWDANYRQKHFPKSIMTDDRPDAVSGSFWWSGNAGEVGIFLTGYESAWLPETLLADDRQAELTAALVSASRHAGVTLHFNKGLAGAPGPVRREARETPIHPSAADAFALAIIASGQQQVIPGLPGHAPDLEAGRKNARQAAAALSALRGVAPDSGAYCSEMSYFEPDWQNKAWGPNYSRLLATKQRHDPAGLFFGHHWVGSEFWDEEGFTALV